MFEIWLPVKGWEGLYEVSDKGRVRSLPRIVPCRGGGMRRVKGQVLKTRPHGFGYPMVCLSGNGRRADRTAHSLVAEAFIGERPEGHHIAHGNGDPRDSVLENLRYATPGENCGDKVAHGTQPAGEAVYCATLKEADIVAIRERRAAGEKLHVIAADYEVSTVYVWQVTTGAKWASAGGPLTKKSKTMRRLTPEERVRAVELRNEGHSIEAVAAMFGASYTQVRIATKDLIA